MQIITHSTYILSPCPECGGDGDFANESSKTRCPVCNGYGQIELHRGSQETEPVHDKAGKRTSPKKVER